MLFEALLILFLNYTNVQESFAIISCSPRHPRIVGGSEVNKYEMPFVASLMRRGGHFCGATIIHEKWLVTAGHCICNGLNQFMKPTQIQAIIGLHSISQYLNEISSEENIKLPMKLNFKKIIPHPKYECTNTNNDIALMEVFTPIHFTSKVQPICLSFKNTIVHEYATVSGWGWTHENQEQGQRADVLRKADVRVWSNRECELSYRLNGNANSISDTQMCAGSEKGGIDSCWADSGGPLISKENMLIGIVSTGIGCGRPGLPGIYTRINKYVSWIENVILANK